jgi:o-succinylbenzoate synthase
LRLSIAPVTVPLAVPFVSSGGSVTTRELLFVELRTEDAHRGYGEAAPLPSYDGVTVDDARAALEDCRPLLAQSDGATDPSELIAACADAAVLPQATAAIDLALWDVAGRRAGHPVWRLLGAQEPQPVQVNATIAASDRAGAAREAGAAGASGFACLKAKVALGDDAGRLAAIRAAAGPQMAIRLDANGAWSSPEAAATLRALEPIGLELCEEPVSGLEAFAELASQTPAALALDETSAAPGALDERHAQAVCLKITRWGGISGLLAAARRAKTAGYEVYLASTLDGPLGIAAALHAAAVIRPDRPCGLATLGQFAPRTDPLPVVAGAIAVPQRPGLGDGLAGWYQAA